MQKKNDSFAQQMASIGKQAEAERLAELKAEQRRALYSKIRKTLLVLTLVVLAGFAYQQREVITVQAKTIAAKTGLVGGNGKSLTGYKEANQKLTGQVQGLQDNALKRSQMVDDILNGGTPSAATTTEVPAPATPAAATAPTPAPAK